MGDQLRAGRPPQYLTEPPRPTQPPTLSGTGNEYQPVWQCSAAGEIKAGWFIPHVNKCVGGR